MKIVRYILFVILLTAQLFAAQLVGITDRRGNRMTPGELKPGNSWPVSHLNAGSAAVTNLLTAPGNNRSYYITGFLLSGGKTADGFNIIRQNCADLDAAADVITVGDNGAMEPGTGDFSLEVWLKVDATASNIVDMIHKDDGSDDGYFLEIVATTSVPKFTMGDGTNVTTISGDTAIDDGEWHHLVISNDDSETDGLNLYLDGVSDATAVDATATVAVDEATDLTINGTNSTQWYCSAVGFYKAGFLDAAEVLTRYNSGIGLKYAGDETDLSFALNMDEGSGTVNYDMVASNNSSWANSGWTVDGIPIDADSGTGNLDMIDIIHCANETQVDASGSYSIPTTVVTFPHAIKVGRNNPLSILETDGAFTLLVFGFTDSYKRKE